MARPVDALRPDFNIYYNWGGSCTDLSNQLLNPVGVIHALLTSQQYISREP